MLALAPIFVAPLVLEGDVDVSDAVGLASEPVTAAVLPLVEAAGTVLYGVNIHLQA